MNKRRRMNGVITSNKMTKTVVVEVSRTLPTPTIPESYSLKHARKGP